MSVRKRTVTITAADQYSPPIALKKGGVIHLSGTWVMVVSLQRYNNAIADFVDVTSNVGSPVVYRRNGTFAVDPYDIGGIYRFGVKLGNFTSGTIVGSIEGR